MSDYIPNMVDQSKLDPALSTMYMKDYAEDGRQEEASTLDWLGTVGEAGYKGVAHGLMSQGPEQFYRMVRTVGDMVGADSWKDWSSSKINAIKAERYNDPFYKVSDDIMADPIASSVYEGFSSITSSLETALPGLLAVAATGGTGAVPILLGYATSAGGIAGLAEYDRFIDEAHSEFSQANPELTWQEVQDQVNSKAILSAVAEGGFEFAGDLLAGKLLGTAGKALTGTVGKTSVQYWRKLSTKMLKGMLISGPLAEVPSELATAATQDKLREWAGMSHQGMVAAMQQAFGPALVGGMVFGGGGAAVEHATNINLRQVADESFAKGIAEQEAALQAQREEMAQSAIVEAFSDENFELSDTVVQDAAQSFKDFGIIDDEGKITPEAMEGFKQFLSGEGEYSVDTHQMFSAIRDSIAGSIDTAEELGVIPSGSRGVAANLYRGFELPQAVSIPMEARAEAIRKQIDVSVGKVAPSLGVDETVNSSLLDETMESPQAVMEYMSVMAKEIEVARQRDEHTTSKLIERGQMAIKNGFNIEAVKQHTGIMENTDSAIMAAGILHDQMNSEVMSAFLNAKRTGNNQDMARAILKAEAANDMSEQLSGLGTASGRALRAMRSIKERRGKDLLDAVHTVLEGGDYKGSRQLLSQLLGNLVEVAGGKNKDAKIKVLREEVSDILNRPGNEPMTPEEWTKINDVLKDTDWQDISSHVMVRSRYGRTRDLILDSSISGMLMGFGTQIANFTGNSFAMVNEVTDRLVAGNLFDGGVIHGNGEVKAMVSGAVEGFRDAVNLAWTAFKTNQSPHWNQSEKTGTLIKGFSASNVHGLLTGKKTDLTREQLYALDGMGGVARTIYKAIDWVGDNVVHLSGRTMMGMDTFFESLVYHMERRAMAHRAGQMAERNGDSFDDAYSHIMDGNKAPDEIHQHLMDYAAYTTFKDRPKKGSAADLVEEIRRNNPSTMFVVPFFRTGLNIAKWAGTRTPIAANLFSEYRDAMNSPDPATKQLAEARQLTGTLLWYTGLTVAAEGLLTGSGPSDDKEREALYATGWRPNSLHVGDKYYELTRLDPVATFFNTAATFIEIQEDLTPDDFAQASAALMGSALKVVSDKYYFQGVARFVNAVTDWDRNGPQFMRDMGEMFVSPVALGSGLRRSVARGVDPVMRETSDFMEDLKKDIPGFSATLAPRRTMLGEVVKYDEGPLGRMFSPVKTGEEKKDPVYDEISRLTKIDALKVSKPSRRMTINGDSTKLTAKQYSRYLELAGIEIQQDGMTAKERLTKLVKSERYKAMPDDRKGELIESIIRTYRSRARSVLIREDESLNKLAFPEDRAIDPKFKPLLR